MVKKKTLLSLVAVSSFALTACGTTDDNPDTTTPPTEEQEDSTTNDTTEDTTQDTSTDGFEEVTVKPVEAFDVFLDKYPNAKVTQIELDKDMDSFRYKVEGFEGNTEHEIKIDPTDATIIKESSDTDNDAHDDGEITREQADKVMDLVDQVLADADEGSTLKEWQLDADDGIVKLEIELTQSGLKNIEYKFNIDTGELIEMD